MAVTLDNVLETNGRKVNCTVAEFFSRVIKQLESVEKFGSASKHRYCLSLLSKFRSTDVRFDEIDYTFLTDFETFLVRRGNKSNSIATKFAVLKSVYNKAIAEGIFVPKINPFLKFKIGRLWKPTRKRAITKEDIHKLITLELPDNRSAYMELGRDVFLFSYFMAGINFKDISTLRWCDIHNGRIYYARHKTSKEMNCKLNPQAQEIISKYEREQSAEDYIFPILDRNTHITERQITDRVHKVLVKVNKHLKELAELAGINTPITTYTGRHRILSLPL